MRSEVKIMAVALVIIVIGAIVGARYYRSTTENTPKPTGASDTMVRPDSPTLGAADAKVTIVEFLDPECEACAAFAPRVKSILKDYEGRARLVLRFQPLHPNSARAITLIEAAGEQGKFWPALDLVMQKQSEWGERHGAPADAPKPDVPALMEKYAMELGLDLGKYTAAVKENKFAAKIEQERRDGQAAGVRQTPTIFVNGRKLTSLSDSVLRGMIDDELRK